MWICKECGGEMFSCYGDIRWYKIGKDKMSSLDKKESIEQFKCSDCGYVWDKPVNLDEISDWIE